MAPENCETLKMDRRKKRTSTNQYLMYINMMEEDPIFATGRIPRDVDVNYLQKKWKELSDKLNTCRSGPTLTSEEWRKRLNDWKNTTRCKYRRSLGDEKGIMLTSLELRALDLFGKAPNSASITENLSIHLKAEVEEGDYEMEHRASESFQKELQAAVEEAIGGEEDEEDDEVDEDALIEEDDEEKHLENDHSVVITNTSNASGNDGGTQYRTIVVENNPYTDEENNDDPLEYIPHRRITRSAVNVSTAPNSVAAAVQTIVTSSPSTTVTKLINGDIPMKRLRTQAPEQIIYEVKKAPISHQPAQHGTRTFTLHNSAAPILQQHQAPQQHQTELITNSIGTIGNAAYLVNGIQSQDTTEVSRQLKRLADIKYEKLKFEIAKFKFKNPGFNYNLLHHQL